MLLEFFDFGFELGDLGLLFLKSFYEYPWIGFIDRIKTIHVFMNHFRMFEGDFLSDDASSLFICGFDGKIANAHIIDPWQCAF